MGTYMEMKQPGKRNKNVAFAQLVKMSFWPCDCFLVKINFSQTPRHIKSDILVNSFVKRARSNSQHGARQSYV